MRPIDEDALIKDMESCCNRSQFGRATAKMCVKRAPTIDPIRAAGGCYCGECKRYKDGICTTYKNSWGGPLEMGEHDFCSNCEPREAKDDG